jgi:hypothetical protein
MTETIVAVLSGCALIGGYLLEWRRASSQAALVALEQRIAVLEAQQIDAERLAAVEALLERLRRNL